MLLGDQEPWRGKERGVADGHPPPSTWDHSELALSVGVASKPCLLIKGLCGYKKRHEDHPIG